MKVKIYFQRILYEVVEDDEHEMTFSSWKELGEWMNEWEDNGLGDGWVKAKKIEVLE